MRRANLVSYSLFASSAMILIGVVYFALNIQVIKDWSLTLPPGDIHAGDTVVVASKYTKLKQVTGTSLRTLECQSMKGIFISYPLNSVKANRAPGTTGTGVIIQIPDNLTGIKSLPDTCHICVALTYPVLPFRTVPYFKCTPDFTLLPNVVSATVDSSATQTSPALAVSGSPSPSDGSGQGLSSTNNTSSTDSTQSNTVQPAASPSVLERVFNPISNLINNVKEIL